MTSLSENRSLLLTTSSFFVRDQKDLLSMCHHPVFLNTFSLIFWVYLVLSDIAEQLFSWFFFPPERRKFFNKRIMVNNYYSPTPYKEEKKEIIISKPNKNSSISDLTHLYSFQL